MHFYQLSPSCKEAEATLYRSPELSLCEVEETRCEIEDTTDIMDMDMDVSPASDQMEVNSDDDGYGGGDIPFHTPHNHTTLQQLQKQKRKRKMLIPVTFNPTLTPTTGTASNHTLRITKPRGFFRREPLSLPAMRLREKWKESVSVRAETALWSGFEFGSGFGFGVIQTGTGFGTGAVDGVGSGRGQGGQGQVRRFYRGREIGHGLPY
ncbi:uncharacterized protein ASPGLDRAFT_30607 [Aspergillus glaucus CBS 516.65]|uniref:Uncharacterized protein n=1 Tax=Aspergillus glaucus CBS 516.65 TaxID=1160497 RepID=A0A1L9V3I4_ASPGL|nr:hypothetical protein ASPGLDRAFT_30607 [Aspergillus glaucus CBS 516.65]OJJ78488.1 hypothetical protein ASPGLDRAFT_30607 [Aspergillus glaucus CBS 516.65]